MDGYVHLTAATWCTGGTSATDVVIHYAKTLRPGAHHVKTDFATHVLTTPWVQHVQYVMTCRCLVHLVIMARTPRQGNLPQLLIAAAVLQKTTLSLNAQFVTDHFRTIMYTIAYNAINGFVMIQLAQRKSYHKGHHL